MVNRLIVERILNDIRTELAELKASEDIDWDVYRSNKRVRRYVERALHVLIEACIDIAQHIIADEKFREPTSYRDAFYVLAEQGVIPRQYKSRFEAMASFRNLILHYYEKVDDSVVYGIFSVYGIFRNNLDDFELFADSIQKFLKSA